MSEMPRYVRVELLVPLMADERNPDDWDWTALCDSELPIHCPKPAVPVAPDDPDLDAVRDLLSPDRLFDREHDFGPDGEAPYCSVCGADAAGSFAASACGGLSAAEVRA